MKSTLTISDFINLSNSPSAKSTIKSRLKEWFYLISKTHSSSLLFEIISTFYSLIILISFPLNLQFQSIWKPTTSWINFLKTIEYFQWFPILNGNMILYFLFFYAVIACVLLLFAMLLFALLQVNNLNIKTITTLRHSLILLTYPWYLPIILTLLSIMSCDEGVNIYQSSVSCWSVGHVIQSIFSGVILTSFAVVTIITKIGLISRNLFKINSLNDVTSTVFEVNFTLIKTIYAIVYIFGHNKIESSRLEWIVIFGYFLLSWLWFLNYGAWAPHKDINMRWWYYMTLMSFSWANFCLLLSKFLVNSSNDGGWALFTIGIVLILGVFYFMDREVLALKGVIINISPKSENEVIRQLNSVIYLVSKIDAHRSAQLLLKGYIYYHEEHCTNPNCSIKAYLNLDVINEEITKYYIFQHINEQYSLYWDQFNNRIRIEYAMFILQWLNKKSLAWQIFLSVWCTDLSLEQEFLVYKYIRYIENKDELKRVETSLKSTVEDRKISEQIKSIWYKNDKNKFKQCVKEVSSWYMDFWTIWLVSNQEDKDCLSKWNNVGKKIAQLNKEISTTILELQEKQPRDKEILKWYCDYCTNVVNDKEQSILYTNKISDISSDGISHSATLFNDPSLDIANVQNPSALSSNDFNQYIIINGSNDHFGRIINISLNLSCLLGYNKDLIIGKKYSEWIPSWYIEEHDTMWKGKIDTLKQQLLWSENWTGNIFYDVNCAHENEVFFINRWKYLIPVSLRGAIISTEDNEFLMAVKVTHNYTSYNDIISKPKSHYSCVSVLVSANFLIRYFTMNAIDTLGLNSDFINSNVMITEFIKEWNEELWCAWSGYSKKHSHEYILKVLHKIHRKAYVNKTHVVTWMKNKNKVLSLTVKEQRIKGTLIGYIYSFSHDNNANSKMNNQFNIPDKAHSKRLFSLGNDETGNLIDDIDYDYIPGGCNFNMDYKQMAFWPGSKTEDLVETREYLKEWVNKKMNLINKEDKTPSSAVESSCSSYDYSDSYSSTSEAMSKSGGSKSTDSKNSTIKELKKEKTVCPTNTKSDGNSTYYQVNIANIKYSIYNFSTHSTYYVETTDWKSEMHDKLQENKKEKISDHPTLTKKQTKTEDKNVIVQAVNDDEIIKDQERDLIVQKQIEKALSKQETLPSIQHLKLASYWSWGLWIVIGFGFWIIFTYAFDELIENSFLVVYGYDLLSGLLRSFCIVMELTLFPYSKYTFKPEDKYDIIAEEQRYFSILRIFSRIIHEKRTSILTTIASFNQNWTEWLNRKDVKIGVVKDNLKIEYFNMTLSQAYSDLTAALSDIISTNISHIYPTHPSTFFYMYNSCNGIYKAQSLHNKYYWSAFTHNVLKYRTYCLIFFILSFLIWCFIYFIWTKTYNKVVKAKERYIEVFFDIERSVLQMFIENVNCFHQKIHLENMSTSVSNLGKDGINSQNNNKFYLSYNGDDLEQVNNKNMNGTLSKSGSRSKPKNTTSKETKKIFIFLAMALVLVLVFVFIIFSQFMIYWDNLQVWIILWEPLYEMFLTYISFYSNIRVYLFDAEYPFLNSPSSDFVDRTIPEWFTTIQKQKTILTDQITKYPDSFAEWYIKNTEQEVCEYVDPSKAVSVYSDLDKYNCDYFFFGSGRYGLNYMISTYALEMIKVKNDYLGWNKLNNGNYVYNLTWIGSRLEDKNNQAVGDPDEDFWKYHPIIILNSKPLQNIAIFYYNVWIPIYSALNENIKSSIDWWFFSKEKMFKLLCIAFIVVNFFWFTLIFIPFVRGLDTIIYLTKNMLVIIPKDVLVRVQNIWSIWNIDSSYNIKAGNSKDKFENKYLLK